MVIEAFPHDSKTAKIKFGNAIRYKGTYQDNGTEHTIYIVHLINMDKGVRVICDIASALFPKYESEFLKTLISIKKN